MHWRTGVDNKFSVLRFKSWCRQAPIFRRWKERSSFLLFEFEQFFGHLPRCFAGTLILPFCLLLRSIFKFGNVGDTLMKSTWANISERLIVLSNLSVTFNSFREFHTLDWFLLHVWALPQETSTASCRERHNPIVVRSMTGVQQVLVSTHDKYHVWHRVSPVFRDFCQGWQQVAKRFCANHYSSACLLRFRHHSSWTFNLVVHQPDDVHTSTFLQICNHSWSCRTSILEDATFHRMELVQIPFR